MKDRIVMCTLISLLLALVATAYVTPVAGAQPEPELQTRIAKTRRTVTAFGPVANANPQMKVKVRLFKRRADGSERLVAARKVGLEQKPSGRLFFSARFGRPWKGECWTLVKVVRRPAPEERADFPCEIPRFESGSATLTTTTQTHPLDLLIADWHTTRSYGLMYRRYLPADKGMAFLWDEDTEGGFWMRNTLIPLSIAFFDADGKILEILDMKPCYRDPCPTYGPGVPYRGALEVNRGTFDDLGIAEGDTITVTYD